MTPLPPGATIAVIGAGIVGVCCAAELAEAGYAVRLFDRAAPGAGGPSKANAAHIAVSEILPLAAPGIALHGWKYWLDPEGPLKIPPSYLPAIAPWIARFMLESRPAAYRRGVAALAVLNGAAAGAVHDLYRRANLLAELNLSGSLVLYESQRSFEASQPGWRIKAQHGFAFQTIEPKELHEYEPDLAPVFAKAVLVPSSARVSDPLRIVEGIFGYAQGKGARFSRNEVEALSHDGARVRLRLASGSTERFDGAVVATGAWSRRFSRALGDRIPLDTERGYNTTLPEPGVEVRHVLVFSDRGFVATPLESGLRIGGWVEFGGLDAPPDYARSRRILDISQRFLPALCRDGGVEWMGHRPSLPDSVPVIGPTKQSNRIVYAFGHGHLGLTQAPATACLVRALVSGAPPPFDPRPFRAARFVERL
jgi:D-amino-acid dehydrogenase